MPTFKVASSSTNPVAGWLVSYNTSTGLVNETTTSEAGATDYLNATAQATVISFINSNSNNTFIGHVPPPPKH